MKLPHFSLFLFFLLFLACGDTEYEYSSHRCYFVYDNSTHQDATIASAMTPYSGVFVTITLTNHGGARYFHFQSNQGTSSESILNAIDEKRTLLLGLNQGLIVGYGTLSDPLTLYAYDRECPNCYDPDRIPVRSHALTTSPNGIARCSSCQREYDMNMGGIIIEGEKGKKLTRYRTTTTGPYGTLSVN